MFLNNILLRTFLFFLIIIISCNNYSSSKELVNENSSFEKLGKKKSLVKIDSFSTNKVTHNLYSEFELSEFKNSSFVKLNRVDSTFLFDMKYATSNNFLKEKVYDCDDCLLRLETAMQLVKANDSFKKLGLKIKLYDCYRPLEVQKKMWKIYPDKRYVANPKKGSNHNRGSAIDITLVDVKGKELPMGTAFDFFGKKAHHSYKKLPKNVLENRKILKDLMEFNGFESITSEWWHYNLLKSYKYEISDFKTKCDN